MDSAPALVVGLCSHGLAICRSLGRRGIPVYALESNESLPGMRTRYAEPILVADINGPALVDDLVRVAQRFDEKPVLFVTNDNMVRVVATHYDRIAPLFRFDWPQPDLVLQLLDKDSLDRFAHTAGLRYPKTHVLSGDSPLDRLPDDLRFPLALKPASPLSAFKALKIHDEAQLRRSIGQYDAEIDCFLVQEWVSGSERDLYGVSLYLDEHHRPIASFVGRKIRAYPRNTGAACSLEPVDRADLLQTAARFFEKVPMRGPVSLEIKEDEEGSQYMIEPNIGRFEFCVQCAIDNGADFPYIAYARQTGNEVVEPDAAGPIIWVDFEKDFLSLVDSIRDGTRWTEAIGFWFRRKSFALWALDDIRPSLRAWPAGARRHARRLLSRLKGSRR